jgi:hypothetical protein
LKDCQESHHHSDEGHHFKSNVEAGNLVRRHFFQPPINGFNRIVLQARRRVDLLNYGVVVGRTIALDVEHRCLAFRIRQLAHRLQRKHLSRALAMLHNSNNTEWMVQNRKRVANVISIAGTGKDVINNHVVRSRERPAGYKYERLQRAERVVIHAVDNLQFAFGHKL